MDSPEPLLREIVGAVLREERHRQGRTLAQIAQASGVSMQHLSDVERGRKDASSELLGAITGALGLSVFTLGERVAAAVRPAPLLDLTGTDLASRSARPQLRPLPARDGSASAMLQAA